MVVPLELEENSTLNADVWEAAGLQCNGTFPLEQFSYDNRVLLNVIFHHLKGGKWNEGRGGREPGKWGCEN